MRRGAFGHVPSQQRNTIDKPVAELGAADGCNLCGDSVRVFDGNMNHRATA